MIRSARAIVSCSIAMLLAWSSPGYGRVDSIKHPARILKTNQRTVDVLAYSADSRQIALAGDSGEVEVWDSGTARRLRTFNGSSKVFAIAFAPDGQHLATSSADNKVNIWRLQGDELPFSIEVPGGPAYSIGYTPDGSRVAAACRDGVIRLYSTDGQLLHAFGDIVAGISIVASPDGARIAGLGSGGLRMWDAETGELVLSRTPDMPQGISHAHWGLSQHPIFWLSPQADFVATAVDPMPGSSPPGIFVLNVWNTVTGKTAIEQYGLGWPLYSFPARGGMIAESHLGGISAIDIKTGKELHRYDIGRHSVKALSFSPDGNWIASGHEDGAVRIWNARGN